MGDRGREPVRASAHLVGCLDLPHAVARDTCGADKTANAAGKGSGLPWVDQDEKMLYSAVESARNGLMCWYIARGEQ